MQKKSSKESYSKDRKNRIGNQFDFSFYDIFDRSEKTLGKSYT